MSNKYDEFARVSEKIELSDGRVIRLREHTLKGTSCSHCIMKDGRWKCKKNNFKELKNVVCFGGFYEEVKGE